MARKEMFVTIVEDGRDKGKCFKITEAPAVQTDKWGLRAMLALNRNGAQIPDEIMKLGLVGVLVVGVHKLRGVLWEDLEPLIDEMMACVQIVPTPSQPNIVRGLFADPNDIEEVSTLSTLRMEVFKLHTGFTGPAARSKSLDAAAGDQSSTIPTPP